MKNLILILLLVLSHVSSDGQDGKIDAEAITICDYMSDVIGSLYSCSFTMHVMRDIPRGSFFAPIEGEGNIAHNSTSNIYMSGPNKLMVDRRGDRGHGGIWYNGSTVTAYSYDENNYVRVDAPDSTINMMYAMNEKYEIEFPAADIFNPYFTDDLIETMNTIEYVGRSVVEGQSAYHLVATNDELHVEIWISDDSILLPVKLQIMYRKRDEAPRYEATFVDWNLNPELPEMMFEFKPPPNARKIAIGMTTTD